MNKGYKRIAAGMIAGFCALSTQSILKFQKISIGNGNSLISCALTQAEVEGVSNVKNTSVDPAWNFYTLFKDRGNRGKFIYKLDLSAYDVSHIYSQAAALLQIIGIKKYDSSTYARESELSSYNKENPMKIKGGENLFKDNNLTKFSISAYGYSDGLNEYYSQALSCGNEYVSEYNSNNTGTNFSIVDNTTEYPKIYFEKNNILAIEIPIEFPEYFEKVISDGGQDESWELPVKYFALNLESYNEKYMNVKPYVPENTEPSVPENTEPSVHENIELYVPENYE